MQFSDSGVNLRGTDLVTSSAPLAAPRSTTDFHRKNIPALDGLRGIAILLVLVAHGVAYVKPVAGSPSMLLRPLVFGWCGVDLFFVLSGFLITGILIRTKAAVNRASSFYGRRVLRIFPIYYLCLLTLFGLAAVVPVIHSMLGLSGVFEYCAFLTFLQNWVVLWKPAIILTSLVGHFWSLGVEEQFYLIWPFIVWRVPSKFLVSICIGGAACAFLLRVMLVWYFGPHFWIQPLTPTRGEGLLIGAALAAARRPIPRQLLTGMFLAGSLSLVFIAVRDAAEFTNTDAGPYMYTLGITALGLLFGSVVGKVTQAGSVTLTAGWLRRFGRYSYGIYIYHVPVYRLTTAALTWAFHIHFPRAGGQAIVYILFLIAISYGLAWFSFQFFETRFLELKDRRFRPQAS